MAKDEAITFEKVKTYPMPEDMWDNATDWYNDFETRVASLNSLGKSKTIRIDATYGFQSTEIKEALQSRIDNKNNQGGDNFGYGKVMKNIIGEYVVTLEDKVGLQKKLEIMERIIGIFNNDEKITKENPQGPAEIIDEELMKFNDDEAIELTLAYIANENPNKITVGKAMGYISSNFPHLRPNLKNIAPKIGKQIGIVIGQVKEGKIEDIKNNALQIYPNLFNEKENQKELKEPIFYQFPAGDLNPSIVRYQINEEVEEIELSKLIRKMKHDKAAYSWLNQHKPNGGPQWPSGGSGQYYLVISNDPFANFTKSSGRYWEQNSCERYNSYDSQYSRGPITDIKYGNCAVFAFKGGECPEGWPEVQPTNKSVGKEPLEGNLLGRQNIKWGYKENEEGNIGMGLDPAFYPRSGAARWSTLLNKALAMIIDSLGYLDYTQMRTPYNYIGHCDVGSGVGNLVYRSGTTCYTKIDNQQVNPDLLMASNELIGYVAFDRLTRPIVDLNIKMILAQNPNIWAIAGNETGIARLIRTKNPDILKFLVSSPNADTEALLGIVNILDEISNDWFEINTSSLAYLIAKHPNANQEIYDILLEKFVAKYIDSYELDLEKYPYWGEQTLFAGVGIGGEIGKTPFVCMGEGKIIDNLLLSLNKDARLKLGRAGERIVLALLFAPKITKAQLVRLMPHVSEILSSTRPELGYMQQCLDRIVSAYNLPLEFDRSWAFNDQEHISLSTYIDFNFEVSRQNTAFLEVLKPYMVSKSYEINIQDMILNTRDAKCHSWFWRNRKSLNIPPEDLVRYPCDVYDITKPASFKLFNDRQILMCLNDGMLQSIKYDFFIDPNSSNLLKGVRTEPITRNRKTYPSKFIDAILSDVDNIENLGWGVVAQWLILPRHFFKYIDLLYTKAFKDLYQGNGRILPPPKDIFELYDMVEDIDILNDAAIGGTELSGGLADNENIPVGVQGLLWNGWKELSENYEGNYDYIYNEVIMKLVTNPNLSPNIMQDMIKEMPTTKYYIANNSNAFTKTLISLYNEYPSQVMSNKGLSDNAYAKLWNNTWRVLNIPLLENPNRIFDRFKLKNLSPLGEYKGAKIRNNLIAFIRDNDYVKFWRGGNVKRGKFSQFQNKNLYSDPVADYPIAPKGKVIVVKFCEDIVDHFKNEVYYLDKVEILNDTTVFIEGHKNYYKVEGEAKINTEEYVIGEYPLNEFFGFIPESNRQEETVIDAEGNEEIITPKWTVDNIVVLQDKDVQTKADKIPSWRFDINQNQVNQILISYLERGMDVEKLMTELETPKNMKSYKLSIETLLIQIDENNLWTRDLINNTIPYFMARAGALFRTFRNLIPTERILQLSIANNKEELEEYGVYDFNMNDLKLIQSKILDYPNLPISYIYYLLVNSTDSFVITKLKPIRRKRSKEFIEYYRKENPAPTRDK